MAFERLTCRSADMIIPEIAWTLNPFERLRYGVPSGLTHSLFDPPKSELCASIDWNLPTPELFKSRWDIVAQCADTLGQYDVEKLRAVGRDSPDFSEPCMRVRIASIVIALMRRGIAPRFSGLLSWRGEKGLLKRSRLYEGGRFDGDIKLIDLIWLLGEERIDDCFKFSTCQQDTGLVLHRIGADRWKSLGCVNLCDGKLQAGFDKANESLKKDPNKLLSLYTHNKMSRDKKKVLADEKALRVFASRVGALSGSRTRWAKGADVYKWVTGLEIDRSDLGKECRAAEKFLSTWAPSARNQKVRNHAETDSALVVQGRGSNAESEVL